VTAKHHDDRAPSVRRVGDRVDDGEEVAGGEDLGERAEEAAERPIAVRRVRELFGADLVRTPGDRDRADRAQVRLAPRYFGRLGGPLSAAGFAAVSGGAPGRFARRNDLR
jgi:hypothetical protein